MGSPGPPDATPPAAWSIDHRRLRFGTHLAVSFQRTVRLTEPSARSPTSYGAAPLWPTDAATRRDLAADVLVPAGAGEAIWIGLEPTDERIASALRVAAELASAAGLVDAVTGGAWSGKAAAAPQNYVASPPQRALYGVSDGAGRARQFVGVETAPDEAGVSIVGLRLACAPPRRIAPLPPRPEPVPLLHEGRSRQEARRPPAGVTDDAFVVQEIAADPYGIEHWDFDAAVPVTVRLVSHDEFERRSGLPRPEPLDSTKIYGGWRLP